MAARIEEHQKQQRLSDEEADKMRRAGLLADAYGDRSSLEELERAMRVYEAERGGG